MARQVTAWAPASLIDEHDDDELETFYGLLAKLAYRVIFLELSSGLQNNSLVEEPDHGWCITARVFADKENIFIWVTDFSPEDDDDPRPRKRLTDRLFTVTSLAVYAHGKGWRIEQLDGEPLPLPGWSNELSTGVAGRPGSAPRGSTDARLLYKNELTISISQICNAQSVSANPRRRLNIEAVSAEMDDHTMIDGRNRARVDNPDWPTLNASHTPAPENLIAYDIGGPQCPHASMTRDIGAPDETLALPILRTPKRSTFLSSFPYENSCVLPGHIAPPHENRLQSTKLVRVECPQNNQLRCQNAPHQSRQEYCPSAMKP